MRFMSTSTAPPAEPPGERDELLICLEIWAPSHGKTMTREGVTAGLPLEAGRLTPGLFSR